MGRVSLGWKLPHPFCINFPHSLGVDTAPQGHKPCESSCESGMVSFPEGLHQPYLSIRTSSWAPRGDREAGHTGEASPDNIPAPAPAGRCPWGNRAGPGRAAVPHLLAQEAHTAALWVLTSEQHV